MRETIHILLYDYKKKMKSKKFTKKINKMQNKGQKGEKGSRRKNKIIRTWKKMREKG